MWCRCDPIFIKGLTADSLLLSFFHRTRFKGGRNKKVEIFISNKIFMKRNGKKFFMPYSAPIVHVQELSFIFIFYFIHTLATKRRNEEKHIRTLKITIIAFGAWFQVKCMRLLLYSMTIYYSIQIATKLSSTFFLLFKSFCVQEIELLLSVCHWFKIKVMLTFSIIISWTKHNDNSLKFFSCLILSKEILIFSVRHKSEILEKLF